MFKILKEKAPNCLINLVPNCEPTIRTRNKSITTFYCRTDCFKYSFFPFTLNDWFNLDLNIRNAEVDYCLLFVQFKEAYTIFSIQKN